MLLKNRILVLVLFSLGAALLAHADTCPVPPTSVYPNISVKVDYDKKSKFYTYTYSVENRRESKVSIESFMLQISEKPYSSQSPSQWLGDFNEGDAELPPTFGWAPALDLIKPGSKRTGFVLKSYRAPGPVRYYIRGEHGDRSASPTPDDDEPIPDCPGFYDNVSVLDGSITGVIDGPAPENQVPVSLRLVDAKGERDCGPVSPYEDKGLLHVLLKADKKLKVSDIDLASLRFGIGQAPLVSSVKIGRSDEVILLKFDTQKVAIECERDRTLFLSGKTKEGLALIGSAAVKTKNCHKRPVRPKNKLDHKKIKQLRERMRTNRSG